MYENIISLIFGYAYSSVSAEKRLCRELMANYSSLGINGRPVTNMSTPIVVSFSLGLINMDLDEKHKILISSMWSRYVSTFLLLDRYCNAISLVWCKVVDKIRRLVTIAFMCFMKNGKGNNYL